MLHCESTDDSHRRFCSLTCLSLYRLKQHSHLSHLLRCDNCQKSQPAYYHVKMSDSSIRSFCCYACVKAFRNKFKVQTITSDAKNQKQITSCENETPRSTPVNSWHSMLSELFVNLSYYYCYYYFSLFLYFSSGGGCNQTTTTSFKTQK